MNKKTLIAFSIAAALGLTAGTALAVGEPDPGDAREPFLQLAVEAVLCVADEQLQKDAEKVDLTKIIEQSLQKPKK